MNFIWVIGAYSPSTDIGKSVIAHAGAGVGYYELNKTRSRGENIVVGFKWANHKEPIPRHLMPANPGQITTLEKMEDKRNGISRKVSSTINIAEMFPAVERI